MKSKALLTCLAAMVVAVSPAVVAAQHAGFQAGIAQPQFGITTPQAPAIVVRDRFTGVPTTIVPAPQVIAPVQVPLVPDFPTVIVPNQVLVPGQTMFSPPVVSPSAGRFVSANTV